MTEVVRRFTAAVNTPLTIDSTETPVIEAALKLHGGKAIINSINFEDGEEKFHNILPLVKKYGAAVIIGSIDEDKQQAQAITRERKLAIAYRKWYKRLDDREHAYYVWRFWQRRVRDLSKALGVKEDARAPK